ncbi:Ig-like domain-containing protein, partial [Kushneria phosphatilytica]|uniref:Ig-like domain-containing protein n=1 Tax=Kushneria phosphatilytica TaxID=657387 RepID=UPI00143C27A0
MAQPALSIALDPIAADNIVNATESVESVPVSGRAFGSASPGDTVSLTIGNTTLTTTLSSDRSFSLNVPGAQLANDHVVTATVTHFAEGGALTSTVSRDYQVDIQAPEVSITLAPITGDNLINVAEADGPIAINGYVGGDVVVGDTVIVTIGAQAFTTHVIDDLSFSINMPAAVFVDSGDHSLLAIVSKVDAAGNVGTATASQNYSVLTTPPALNIQLDTLAGDNIVNADEANQTVPVTGMVSGEYAAGDLVTLTVGNQTYVGAVNAEGTFSINVPGSQLAQNGSLQAFVSHTDAAGNIGTANTAASYGVDTEAPIVTISLDAIADDDVLNAAEAGQDVAITGTAGGDAVSGDVVTVNVGGQNYTAIVDQNGGFSVSVAGSVLAAVDAGNVSASVSHTDAAGNVSSATTSRDYSIDTTPPALSIQLDTLAGDNIVNAAEAGQDVAITGTAGGDAVPGDTVTINVGGQNYTAIVDQNGGFSVAVAGTILVAAGTGNVSASVSHTDAAGNVGSATTSRDYSVDTTPPA